MTKAFLDPEFRQRLKQDIWGTAREWGEDLSAEEIEEIQQALEEGDSTATGLDQRLSKSGVSLSPQAMLRQKGGGFKRPLRTTEASPTTGSKVRTARKDERMYQESNKVDDIEYDLDEPDYEVERD